MARATDAPARRHLQIQPSQNEAAVIVVPFKHLSGGLPGWLCFHMACCAWHILARTRPRFCTRAPLMDHPKRAVKAFDGFLSLLGRELHCHVTCSNVPSSPQPQRHLSEMALELVLTLAYVTGENDAPDATVGGLAPLRVAFQST